MDHLVALVSIDSITMIADEKVADQISLDMNTTFYQLEDANALPSAH
jgi:hypothetical protein